MHCNIGTCMTFEKPTAFIAKTIIIVDGTI